jgi:ADP-heptose:LPS heptosyltransferase
MNLRTKQRLDWVAGGLALALLRPAVLLLGRLLRRDHARRVGRSICVFKLLGGGSLVIAFPALLGLRERHPNVELSLLCTPAVAPFARTLRLFDRVIVIDDSAPVRLLWTALRAWWQLLGTDTVIDLEVYSRLSTVFSLLTCARNRFGFYLESAFWRRGVLTHLVFFNRFSGSYLFYEKLVELLDAKPASAEACRLHLLEGIPEREPRGEIATVCIGSACSEMGRERMLAPAHWEQVLAENAGGAARRFVLLGGGADREDAQRVLAALRARRPGDRFENRCGELTLEESVAVLAGADEFWGIDSALLHYARLLRTPCLSFWGPTHPETRLKPIDGLTERVVYRKVPCSPCIHLAEEPPCGGNNVCIRNLFESAPGQELEWCSRVEARAR